MAADVFRMPLGRRLKSASDRGLLRVLVSRRDSDLGELTGPDLGAWGIEIARSDCQTPPSGAVLLPLPQAPWINAFYRVQQCFALRESSSRARIASFSPQRAWDSHPTRFQKSLRRHAKIQNARHSER